MYIDSHVHLTDPELLAELPALLERAKSAGVSRMLVICSRRNALKNALQLKLPDTDIAAAIPPHDALEVDEEFFREIESAALGGKCVAVGETGLDFAREESPKKEQEALLLRHVALAEQAKLPLIFHCREAFQRLFEMAGEFFPHRRALLHCFTGTQAEMESAVERGWYLSFSGILTYKNAAALREVARMVPLEHILVETDAPYLAPQSRRGSRNEPAFIVETVAKLAELKGLSVEEMGRITAANYTRFANGRS